VGDDDRDRVGPEDKWPYIYLSVLAVCTTVGILITVIWS
jgi:hypothetical protein